MKNSNLLRANFIAVAIAVLLLSGCRDENDTASPIGSNGKPNFLQTIGTGAFMPFIDNYDQTNAVGLVQIKLNNYDKYRSDGVAYAQIDKDAYAVFVNPNDIDQDMSVGDVMLNSSLLKEYATGSYRWQSSDPDGLTANFGNGGYNRIQTDSAAPIFINDSVQFSAPVQIIGITKGQNISRSQSFTINWSGTNSDFVAVDIMRTETWNDSLNTPVGYAQVLDNTGSTTIAANKLQDVKNGKAVIRVTKYEPKFITLASGKRICVLGTSKHEIDVNLVN